MSVIMRSAFSNVADASPAGPCFCAAVRRSKKINYVSPAIDEEGSMGVLDVKIHNHRSPFPPSSN